MRLGEPLLLLVRAAGGVICSVRPSTDAVPSTNLQKSATSVLRRAIQVSTEASQRQSPFPIARPLASARECRLWVEADPAGTLEKAVGVPLLPRGCGRQLGAFAVDTVVRGGCTEGGGHLTCSRVRDAVLTSTPRGRASSLLKSDLCWIARAVLVEMVRTWLCHHQRISAWCMRLDLWRVFVGSTHCQLPSLNRYHCCQGTETRSSETTARSSISAVLNATRHLKRSETRGRWPGPRHTARPEART